LIVVLFVSKGYVHVDFTTPENAAAAKLPFNGI
jgi:hypothetical protein